MVKSDATMKTLCCLVVSALTLASAAEVKVVMDVPYVAASADAYRTERCKLDLQLPDGTNFPTLVWFHGGGLTGGGKSFLKIDSKIAQVAPNYRLMKKDNGVQGEDCINDAAAAVAWTLRHVAEYGGDPKKVYVGGISAGGYLTMMVGMAPKYLAEHGYRLTDLAGLAPVSGQATKHFNVRKFAGDTDPQFLPKIDDLAPLRWVAADLPPILDVCGEPPWEWQCRSEENRLLIASCTALGHKNAYFVCVPYCDHSRTFRAGTAYVEMFVQGRMPKNLVRPEEK